MKIQNTAQHRRLQDGGNQEQQKQAQRHSREHRTS